MSIATNLKREMDARAVTVAALAALSGVEAHFVRKYLSGRVKPSDDVLERLACGLGCEASDLLRVRVPRTCGKIYPEDAARRLHRNAQDIRIGLQHNIFPFGTAYKKPGSSTYTYEIDPAALDAYVKAQESVWAELSAQA